MTFSAERPNHVLSTSGEEVLEMKVFFCRYFILTFSQLKLFMDRYDNKLSKMETFVALWQETLQKMEI
jgi:hypothetical protein